MSSHKLGVEFCVLIRDGEGRPEWRVHKAGLTSRYAAAAVINDLIADPGSRAEYTIGVRELVPFSRLIAAPIYKSKEGGAK